MKNFAKSECLAFREVRFRLPAHNPSIPPNAILWFTESEAGYYIFSDGKWYGDFVGMTNDNVLSQKLASYTEEERENILIYLAGITLKGLEEKKQ